MIFTLLKKTRIQYPLLAALLCCSFCIDARSNDKDDPKTTVATEHSVVAGEQNGGQSGATGTRYTYAELMYQRAYGTDKFVVNGKTVTEQIRSSVAKAKYTDAALEIMGAEGWELVSTVTRNFDSGYEFYYYFKKKAN